MIPLTDTPDGWEELFRYAVEEGFDRDQERWRTVRYRTGAGEE